MYNKSMKKPNRKGLSILKFSYISLAIIAGVVSLFHTICTIKAFSNYDYNVAVWAEYNHSGLINFQGDFDKLKFGFGDIGANGCGAIAVYNILVLENKPHPLPDIIKQFDLCGENLFGLAGSKPARVERILRRYGLKVTHSLNKSKFESIAQQSKYAIYVNSGTYKGQLTGHYQLIYNYDGEKYDALNPATRYTFEEIIDAPDSIFSMMIGVNT